MALFERALRLSIGKQGAVDVSQGIQFLSDGQDNAPHITFEIVKTISEEPNSAKITVYNSLASIKKILPQGTDYSKEVVILEAGYARDVGLKTMFLGNITNVELRPQKPDNEVMIQGHDGYDPMVTNQFGKSYQKKTSAKKVLTEHIDALGATPAGVNLDEVQDEIFEGGYTSSGPTAETVKHVCKKLNLQASFQAGKIFLTPIKGVKPSELVNVVQVNEYSGMIGAPESIYDKVFGLGYRLKSLLIPDIEPGMIVQPTTLGTYRVRKVTHQGGTYTTDFQTEILAFTK